MSRIFVIDRDGNSHDVPATPGGKVMETLRELDYGVAAICGGLCSCATCHVYIDHEWLPKIAPMHSDEREMLKELSTFRPDTSRLSCQIEFTPTLDGLKLTIAPEE